MSVPLPPSLLLALGSVCMHAFFCPGFRSPSRLQGQKDSPMLSSLSFLYSYTFGIQGYNASGFCSVFCMASTQLYFFPYCRLVLPPAPNTHVPSLLLWFREPPLSRFDFPYPEDSVSGHSLLFCWFICFVCEHHSCFYYYTSGSSVNPWEPRCFALPF